MIYKYIGIQLEAINPTFTPYNTRGLGTQNSIIILQ